MEYDSGTHLWESVGTPGFSDGEIYTPSLVIYDDTPYVAYQDNAHDNKATVMKYTSTGWITVGDPGFSDGSVDYVSLAIDNGIPYVAYRDNNY
jgi:hypothetical protein